MIAPARTGSDRRRRIVVIFTDQTNKGIWSRVITIRSSFAVVMKLIDARIDLTPAR